MAEKRASAAAMAELGSEPLLAFVPKMRQMFPDAEWYLVGGAVRDLLIGRRARKDFDLVVRRVSLEDLSRGLSKLGRVDLVGRTFGVLKFVPEGHEDEAAVDIAWPRTERAGMSGGYRDFSVYADPELPLDQDLSRRDFTMNAIALDLQDGRIIDPYDGWGDIGRKLVRAVGKPSERFAEDYSRMLRAVRFACQLGFTVDGATWEGIKANAGRIDDLRGQERVVPYETVAKELTKAMAAAPRSCADLLESCGLLYRLMPELEPMASCEQPKNFHSEGDVWTHTKLALSALSSPAFAELFPGESFGIETAFAVLYHDVAKPLTRERHPDGSITFYGHAERGARIVKHAADRLRLPSVAGYRIVPDRLAWLVKMHLVPNVLDMDAIKKTTLHKHFIADRDAGRALLHLAFADASATVHEDGTIDLSGLKRTIAVIADLEKSLSEGAAKPKWLMSGDDVMENLGISPGREVGELLAELHEAQLRGQFHSIDEAKDLLKKLHGHGGHGGATS
jgi:tRNA nucleotidyltransferase/poly(A) polymerase